jgi:hypothetical protein
MRQGLNNTQQTARCWCKMFVTFGNAFANVC